MIRPLLKSLLLEFYFSDNLMRTIPFFKDERWLESSNVSLLDRFVGESNDASSKCG